MPTTSRSQYSIMDHTFKPMSGKIMITSITFSPQHLCKIIVKVPVEVSFNFECSLICTIFFQLLKILIHACYRPGKPSLDAVSGILKAYQEEVVTYKSEWSMTEPRDYAWATILELLHHDGFREDRIYIHVYMVLLFVIDAVDCRHSMVQYIQH